MDLGNPVLRLCQDGMRAEAEGRLPDARALFEQAWAARTDGYDACVAAHYLARTQDDPAATLHWNQESLRHADAIFIQELRRSGWYEKTSQAFAVFLPVKSVGVTGDGRRHEPVIALRAE